MEIAAIIRGIYANALIISGGGLASSIPKYLLQTSEIDIACCGEGENIISKAIITWFEGGIGLISGLVWKDKKSKEIVCNAPPVCICNLDSIKYPNWEKAGLDSYFKFSSLAYKGINSRKLNRRTDLATTRGCPYNCSFCSSVFERKSIRYRSVSNIINEIIELKERDNIDSIDFLDENFCFSRKRVLELCTAIIDNNLNL